MMQSQLAAACGHLREALQGEDALLVHLIRKAFPGQEPPCVPDAGPRRPVLELAFAEPG
jgi:hypothetical protein